MKNSAIIKFCRFHFFIAIVLCFISCLGQSKSEDANTLSENFDEEMPFSYKMPSKLTATDESPAWDKNGQKIKLTGKIYQNDGKTPAQDVILYYYQTNTEGVYETDSSEERNMPKNKLGQTHGYIRGWVKTDKEGNYSIYTIKPGSYPNTNAVAHVHVTVDDPLMDEPYYIDDFIFEDDPNLTSNIKNTLRNRGGNGIISFKEKDGILIGKRDIILGLNIPNYPD